MALNLVIAAFVYWNTMYMDKAAQHLQNAGQLANPSLLRHVSPLGWMHINLTGDFVWNSGAAERMNARPLHLNAASDDFGRAVAGAGDINGDGFDDLVFGARYADAGGDNRGAAYVVFGGAGLGGLDAANGPVDGVIDINDLDGANGFRVVGVVDQDRVGQSVGAAGDVNGDGFDDLIIGQLRSNIFNEPGSASLFFGHAGGFAPSFSIMPADPASGYRFSGRATNLRDETGYSVSSAGDVNGDGFDDMLIGARRDDVATGAADGNEGAVYLVFGGDANLVDLDDDDGIADGNIALANLVPSKGAVFTGETTNTGAEAGRSVHGVGDVNGDGLDDFIIGSRGADPNSGAGNSGEGAAYLVFGRPDAIGFSQTNLSVLNGVDGVIIEGVANFDRLGGSVSGGGDINGDGFDDVIVGASYADPNGFASSGSAYVIFGKSQWSREFNPANLNGVNGFRVDGLRNSDYTGISVSMAGDINGDGFEDVAIAAHFFDQPGASNAGAVFVVFGKPDGFTPVIDLGALDGDDGFRVDGPGQSSAILGRGIQGPAGDINGDGFDDLVIGAYREDTVNGIDSGAAYVVFGHKALGSVHRVGTHLSQTQNGGVGIDTIEGNDGDDVLIGHESGDVLNGGFGRDTASYFGASSGVTASLADSSVNTGDAEGDSYVSIENLSGSDHADQLTGNSAANILSGGLGNDTMTGGADNDIYVVDNAGDVVTEVAAEGTDTVRTHISYTLGVNVGNLELVGSSGISGTGNALDNEITGNDYYNVIEGGGGADTINGGDGLDTASYAGSSAGVVVNLLTGVTAGGDAAGDTLVSIERLLGSANDDVLVGTHGGNYIDGSGGADYMRGLGGRDTYIGDNTGDIVDESFFGSGGVDTVRGSVSVNLTNTTNFKGDIENIVLTGGSGTGAVGNALNNTIAGNNAGNVIAGGLGNDTLTGNGGYDRFVFNTALNAATNVDVIMDYALEDQINLENAIFTTLASTGFLAANLFKNTAFGAVDADDRIIYNSATGALVYDTDGSGAAAATLFAQLSSGLAIDANEFFVV
jgi:hypothetical protein